MKERMPNQERLGVSAMEELTNTAERRKEENEQLRREVEDKKTQISCMVSAKELEYERKVEGLRIWKVGRKKRNLKGRWIRRTI